MHLTRAFVLSRKERREADILATLFTEQFGLIRAVAAGIKKPGAKLRGHLEPFSDTEIHFVPGRIGYRLIGAIVQNPFSRITSSLERYAIAEAGASLIEAATLEGSPDSALWEALQGFFTALDSPDELDSAERERILFWLAARLFFLLGYQASESSAYSKEIQALFKLYETAPALEAARLSSTAPLHDAMRHEIFRAFEEHLGIRPSFLAMIY